jgi:hypothetical protein
VQRLAFWSRAATRLGLHRSGHCMR